MKFKTLSLWIGIPVAVVIIWIFAFYQPVSKQITSKKQEMAGIADEVRRLDNEIKALLDLKRKEEVIKSSLREFQGQIPLFDNFPDFIKQFAVKARRDGLIVDRFSGKFRSLDLAQKTVLTYPVFEVGLKGRFMEMGAFMEYIDSMKAYRRILNAKILYNDKEYPMLTGKFEIEFKAWKERGAFESK